MNNKKKKKKKNHQYQRNQGPSGIEWKSLMYSINSSRHTHYFKIKIMCDSSKKSQKLK